MQGAYRLEVIKAYNLWSLNTLCRIIWSGKTRHTRLSSQWNDTDDCVKQHTYAGD